MVVVVVIVVVVVVCESEMDKCPFFNTQPNLSSYGPNPTHPSHTYMKCRHRYYRTHIFTCPLFHNYVSSKIKGRECLYL